LNISNKIFFVTNMALHDIL